MFSMMTIALSTIIPTPRARAPNDMVLRVKPLAYINMNVPMTVIGIEAATIRVLRRFRRKKRRARIASRLPEIAADFRLLIDCVMNFEESKIGWILICGKNFLIDSSSS